MIQTLSITTTEPSHCYGQRMVISRVIKAFISSYGSRTVRKIRCFWNLRISISQSFFSHVAILAQVLVESTHRLRVVSGACFECGVILVSILFCRESPAFMDAWFALLLCKCAIIKRVYIWHIVTFIAGTYLFGLRTSYLMAWLISWNDGWVAAIGLHTWVSQTRPYVIILWYSAKILAAPHLS